MPGRRSASNQDQAFRGLTCKKVQVDEIWSATLLLDKLGLYTTEAHQRSRESQPNNLRDRPRQAKWPWSAQTRVVNLHRSPISWKSEAL